MKTETEIDNAIKILTQAIKKDIDSADALRLSQASLNLAHTRSVIIENEKRGAEK